MRKALISTLFFALLLSACSGGSGAPAYTAVAAPLPPVEIVLLLPEGSEDALLQAAKLFGEKANEISGGSMRVTVASAVRPEEQLAQGGGQLALLRPKNSETLGLLTTAATPFLYSNYTEISQALNSDEILSRLKSGLAKENVVPIAAYYLDSGHLLSTLPLSDIYPLRSALAAGDVRAAVPDGPEAGYLLAPLNLEIIAENDSEARMNMLQSGRVQVAEFTYRELYRLEWENDYGDTLHYNRSYSSLELCWLVVDRSFYDSLTPAGQAVLTEAAAYLFPAIDQTNLLRDSQVDAMLRDKYLTINSDFSVLREQIFRFYAQEGSQDEQTALFAQLRKLLAGGV